jgi:hypothetical protein
MLKILSGVYKVTGVVFLKWVNANVQKRQNVVVEWLKLSVAPPSHQIIFSGGGGRFPRGYPLPVSLVPILRL